MNYPNEADVHYADIQGFPGYCVGDDGSVWSRRCPSGGMLNRWKRMKPGKERRYGRKMVMLSRSGKAFGRTVHRLVLEAFVGVRPAGKECCHRDGNPGNNALSNLRWDSHEANGCDMVAHGKSAKGERNGSARLFPEDVREIRRLSLCGLKQKFIAKILGTTQGSVSRIINSRAWSHL